MEQSHKTELMAVIVGLVAFFTLFLLNKVDKLEKNLQEVRDQAAQAESIGQDAYDLAQQDQSSVDDAQSRADEAYDLAQDACDAVDGC